MHYKYNYLFTAILLLGSVSTFAQNYNLTLKISNVQATIGDIHIAIFRPEDNFPYEAGAWKEFNTPAVQGETEYTIENLPGGEYAIAIFHDENQSGKCETNFIGYPKESYCFSRNFKVFLSAPPFSKCGITLDEDKTINVMMRR